MAFGIRSNFDSASARRGRLVIAPGAWLGPAWRQLRRCIARRRESQALADLDDCLLRDIGVIRERDIGMSREAVAREIDNGFWRP